MRKTRRRIGRKRKSKCHGRRTKRGRHRACKRTHKRRKVHHKRKRRGSTKRRLRHRGGYSGIKVPLSPANFQGPSQPTLPPFGPVNVPVRGVTKFHDGEYYYAKNPNVIAAPRSTNSAWGKKSQTGGRKKKKRKKKKKKKKKSCQRGGTSSSVVNALPGGTDFRDLYWSQGNKLVNLYDNWNGYAGRMSTAASVQPIGKSGNLLASAAPVSTLYQDAGLQASKSPYQAY